MAFVQWNFQKEIFSELIFQDPIVHGLNWSQLVSTANPEQPEPGAHGSKKATFIPCAWQLGRSAAKPWLLSPFDSVPPFFLSFHLGIFRWLLV